MTTPRTGEVDDIGVSAVHDPDGVDLARVGRTSYAEAERPQLLATVLGDLLWGRGSLAVVHDLADVVRFATR